MKNPKRAFSVLLVGGMLLVFAVAAGADTVVIPLSISNHSFEDGDLTGWNTHMNPPHTNNIGVVNYQLGTSPANAQDGEYFASMRALGSQSPTTQTMGWIDQWFDVSAYAGAIDARLVSANLTGWGYGETGGTPDFASLGISFLDAGMSYMETYTSSPTVLTGVWEQLDIPYVKLPVGTRYMTVAFVGAKYETNYFDVGFDNMSGNLKIVPLPVPVFAGLAMLGGLGLVRKFRK